jgi:hypothetical protein
MTKLKVMAVCFAFLGVLADAASGATNGVVLGQSFQSVIDASAPGDVLIVQPGLYLDTNTVFNKSLAILPSGTNGGTIQFLGPVQVTGSSTSSFQKVYFGDTVQIAGSTASFFDSVFNASVTAAGGKVTFKRTIFNGSLTLSNNASLEALRTTNYGSLTATATSGSGATFLAVQSRFFETVVLSGYKVWLGYNDFSPTAQDMANLQQTDCESVLIGNRFTANAYIFVNAISATRGNLKAYNNFISGNMASGSTWRGGWLGVVLNSTTAEFVNNTIRCGNGYKSNGYRGMQVSGGGSVILRGNIISLNLNGNGDCGYFLSALEALGAASQSVFSSYCDLHAALLTCPNDRVEAMTGIVPPPVNCLLQINPNLGNDGSPNPGSPCLNAGPPEAIYNNRDGTRNTMGFTGGPYWNPANYTNNNPMVFFLTGQQMVLSGVQTNIQINAAAAAGH